MKINLRKSSKKICLLLAICATALTFVPTAFAGKNGPEQVPSEGGREKHKPRPFYRRGR